MQLYNYLKPKMHIIGTFAIALTMFSCGSYQYAGYEDDSIYGDTERNVEYVEVQTPASNNSQYYKDYFSEKSQLYASITEEDNAIFTDIDSYEGTGYEENDTIYQDSYAGWGEFNDDVTINIYGGHAFNSIWWNRPLGPNWLWNYGYGYGNVWGYGFNSWGWNRPLWLDFGYGWGWGYNNWWCPPFYNNWAWNRPYWNNGYYGGYYNARGLAFNSTRRGASYYGSSLATVGRRSSINSGSPNYNSRRSVVGSNLNRRGTSNRVGTSNNRRRVGTTSSSRFGSRSSRVGTTSSRGSRTRPTATTSRSRPNISSRSNRINSSSGSRINNSSRSSRSSGYRPSGSSSRSSGSMSRSSSSSSRSSGSRSSSTRSSSRRGNN